MEKGTICAKSTSTFNSFVDKVGFLVVDIGRSLNFGMRSPDLGDLFKLLGYGFVRVEGGTLALWLPDAGVDYK